VGEQSLQAQPWGPSACAPVPSLSCCEQVPLLTKPGFVTVPPFLALAGDSPWALGQGERSRRVSLASAFWSAVGADFRATLPLTVYKVVVS